MSNAQLDTPRHKVRKIKSEFSRLRVTSVVTFKEGGPVVFIERTYKRGKFNFEREFRFTTGEYP